MNLVVQGPAAKPAHAEELARLARSTTMEKIGEYAWRIRKAAPADGIAPYCERERLDFADTAARVRIGEPELAVGILSRQRFFRRLDRADVAKAELFDQRIAIGERLVEKPAGIEKDHGDRGVDIRRHLQQRRRFGAE